MEVVFLVQGSAAEPYEVTFVRDGSSLFCRCTCDAAAMGTHCKHRLDILRGDASRIVSENAGAIAAVVQWLPGSTLAAALAEVADAEAETERAKKRLTSAKKALGRLMTR